MCFCFFVIFATLAYLHFGVSHLGWYPHFGVPPNGVPPNLRVCRPQKPSRVLGYLQRQGGRGDANPFPSETRGRGDANPYLRSRAHAGVRAPRNQVLRDRSKQYDNLGIHLWRLRIRCQELLSTASEPATARAGGQDDAFSSIEPYVLPQHRVFPQTDYLWGPGGLVCTTGR